MKRPLGPTRLVAASVVVAVGIGFVVLRRATESPGSAAPVAFTGSIAGMTNLRPDDLLVLIRPDDHWLAAHESAARGSQVPETTVPAGAITTHDATYEVRLDPTDLPPWAISRHGMVSLVVMAESRPEHAYGSEPLWVRAVLLPDGDYAWTDPSTSTAVIHRAADQAPGPVFDTYEAGAGPGLPRRFHPTDMWAKETDPAVLDISRFTGRGSLSGLRASLKRRAAQGH